MTDSEMAQEVLDSLTGDVVVDCYCGQKIYRRDVSTQTCSCGRVWMRIGCAAWEQWRLFTKRRHLRPGLGGKTWITVYKNPDQSVNRIQRNR